MAKLLDDRDFAERLEGSQWNRQGDEIVREWKFDDFASAMAFVNRVSEVAEDANHHPDILCTVQTRFGYRSPTIPPVA